MKKLIIKEAIIYFVMLLLLAILMHGSELPHRLVTLPLAKAWHPFVYTFVIYALVGLVRLAVYKIKSVLLRRKTEN